MRMIRIGCSGWNYAHWRNLVYPPGLREDRWLEHYAGRFDTVEINATFYRLPVRSTVARWASTTPRGFCFSVKASRYLTHVRRLQDLSEGVARLMDRLEPLVVSAKLGPTLWQLPPTFRRNDERLASALEALPHGRHAFEFRHPSWFVDDVYSLLRGHSVAVVVADRASLPEAPWVHTTDWWYVRFHHGRLGRRGNYSQPELRRWAEQVRRVRGDIYCYFNNDWEGFAVDNANRLQRFVGEGDETGRRRAA